MDDVEKKDIVDKYLDMVLEANKLINLTRIDTRPEAEILHIEDSLAGLDELPQAPAGRYGDLGSGCGFPGVPLGIYSERDTVLIDSVKKKMKAVARILSELHLEDSIRTYDGRIEELSLVEPKSFAVLTARAVSRLVSLVELASPLLQKYGRLICFKGIVDDAELREADEAADIVGMRFVSKKKFLLSDGETKRSLIVYEKIGNPRIPLPRNTGQAQHNPLSVC